MSAINREQALFLAVLVVLGGMTYYRLQDRYHHRSVPRASHEFESAPGQPAAEIQRADSSTEFLSRDGRNIFAPPRDWLPLENLILDFPPLAEFPAVPPFTRPGLGSRSLHRMHFTPGDLAFPAGEASGEEALAASGASQDSEGAGSAPPGETSKAAASSGPAAAAGEEIDAEEAHKRQYDWIQLKGQASRIYGRILNDNKYDLSRNREPINFQQVALRTGKAMSPFEYARERIEEFGFADTVKNRIELAIREVPFHAGNLKAIHDKARWCLTLKDEDPIALDYAVQLAKKAIELDPLSKESYCLLADIYEQNMDYEGALKTLRSAMEQRLNAPGIFVRYGRWLQRYGMDDAALQAYEEAEKIQPEFAEALVARAGLLYKQEAYEDALALYEAAWRSPSWEPELKITVLLGESRNLLGLDRLDQAAAKIGRAVHLEEEKAEVWNVKGAVAFAQNDTAAAEEAFREASALAPENGVYLTNLGCALLRQGCLEADRGRIREAIRKFEESAAVDPVNSCRALAGKGFAHECLGEDEQASSAYEQAVRVDPTDFYALYLKGRDLRRHGDTSAAADTLKEALKRNDRMVEILGELGYASLLAGKDEDAVFYFEEYQKRAPAGCRLLYLHGLALLKQNRLEDAEAKFTEASKVAADRPEPYLGLAYAFHAAGAVDEALAEFGKAVRLFETGSLDPRLAYAQRWMARVEEHRRKSQWLDAFERKTIKNDWYLNQRSGLKIDLIKNHVVFRGVQRQEQPDERTELRREIPGQTFRSFEADVSLQEGDQGRCGLFAGLYISRGVQGMLTKAEISFALEPNGSLVYNVKDKGDEVGEWIPVPGEKVEPGTWVRLGIELEDYDEGVVRLTLNGEPALPDLTLKSLRKANRPLMLGVFASAAGSRKVDAAADNVRIVVQN